MLEKRLLLLTGNPGIGKTTTLLKVNEGLKAAGYRVGGMISREVRSNGNRIGFEVMDLETNKVGWLARANQDHGPRLGKYGVNLGDLESIGVQAIINATRNCDIVAIDEVGPMELFLGKFKKAVKEAAESRKLIICIVHCKAKSELIDNLKAREDAETYVVTHENRGQLHKTILEEALQFLCGTASQQSRSVQN